MTLRISVLILALAVAAVAFAAGLTATVAQVTTYDDGSAIPADKPVTYVLYDGTVGTELTRGPDRVFPRPTAAPGKRCYKGAAIVEGVESDFSPTSCLDLSPPPPPPKKKPSAPTTVDVRPNP